jgi:serine/threonine protein phosphatase 1
VATFAIGDVHGCLASLDALLNQIAPRSGDHLVFLGDYIDRGPDSRGVIQRVIELSREFRVTPLKGNHEMMMMDVREKRDTATAMRWHRNGGKTTIDSYGWPVIHPNFPRLHLDWLEKLPMYLDEEGYLYVHGGLDLKSENPLQDEKSMAWARNWYDEEAFQMRFPGGKVVIHGHTPISREEIERLVDSNSPYFNLDGGCVYCGRRPGMGWLVGLHVETRRLFFQECVDDVNF